MFAPQDRDRLLEALVAAAQEDGAVTGAALVGSAARGETDAWSDIDLALRLDGSTEVTTVADSWRTLVNSYRPVADELDVWAGTALYRVFLLADSLQVDVSFWPPDDFGSTGEPFILLFGSAQPDREIAEVDCATIIGWGWLDALHARSAIARGRWWQALEMINGLRDRTLALACLRHGLPAHQGRGVDRLPVDFLAGLAPTLVARPDQEGTTTAFAALIMMFLDEVDVVDAPLAARLREPLTTLLK